jgi:hypothetical protein
MVIVACAQREVAADDQRLLDYASRSYDEGAMVGTKISLGIHNGVPLIVEFPCSDICPDYTVRIIHYDLKAGQACSQADGIEKSVWVPEGIARIQRTFCFPAVLVENWHKYRM